MTKDKIEKLRQKLERLRAGKYNMKRSDLTKFATSIWRKEDTKRGKEPTFISIAFPELRPISIPRHRYIKPFTAESIIDSFELDLNTWEEHLESQEKKQNEQGKKLLATTIRQNRDSRR
jgi:hypothetical protein